MCMHSPVGNLSTTPRLNREENWDAVLQKGVDPHSDPVLAFQVRFSPDHSSVHYSLALRTRLLAAIIMTLCLTITFLR